MKHWFLVPLLSASLFVSARADDLNERAAQIKTQLQTSWLPAWAAKSPANESATDAAQLVQTLSHAHRLGYSTPQLDLLKAARVHYQLLRDSRQDKTNGGFFAASGGNTPLKSTELQAQVVSALVEFARASGEAEPRGLAIKTWRFIRDRGRDKVNGGYFDSIMSGPLAPTQASGSGQKSASTHLALLEAATALVELTRDRSITTNLVELLDLNEGRFFSVRADEKVSAFTPTWKPIEGSEASQSIEAGAAIARAQQTLGLPVSWVDFSRRADEINSQSYGPSALTTLTMLTSNIPASRERRATQIDQGLNDLNAEAPAAQTKRETLDASAGLPLLDFVAAFSNSSGK